MRRRLAAALALAAGALLSHEDTRADDAGADQARRAKAVAVVGTAPVSNTISVGELEDRIAEIPTLERAGLGPTADAIRRRVLTDVVAQDARLSLAAESAHLEGQLAIAFAMGRARSNAVVRSIRDGIGPPSAIPMEDVRDYYEENLARYDAPKRYQIWRILCKTTDDARAVLDEARADPTPKTFTQLARDHSEDKATYLRGGNLGFLAADGASSEPGLRVDPAIVRAAEGVRDGELVQAPVGEGSFFSVVWRRGTIAPKKRSLDEVAAQIRDVLWAQRIKDATDKRVADLRAAKVRDVHEDLLDAIDLSVEIDGGAPPRP